MVLLYDRTDSDATSALVPVLPMWLIKRLFNVETV
jgi:hypothetical protein